jgi:tetratricopeptide (TPR) repeat protein
VNGETGAEVQRLGALGAGAPGAAGFPALAEAQRRAGRAEEALRIAEHGLREQPDLTAGRVALALALLDLGRVDDARRELARVLDEVPDHPLAAHAYGATAEAGALAGFDDLAESELEDAFGGAEPARDEMLDANVVAAAALRSVEEGRPEGVVAPDAASPFATHTVADLLERQGHGSEAQALRAAIGRRGATPGDAGGDRVIATLERWLDNLRRRSR